MFKYFIFTYIFCVLSSLRKWLIGSDDEILLNLSKCLNSYWTAIILKTVEHSKNCRFFSTTNYFFTCYSIAKLHSYVTSNIFFCFSHLINFYVSGRFYWLNHILFLIKCVKVHLNDIIFYLIQKVATLN